MDQQTEFDHSSCGVLECSDSDSDDFEELTDSDLAVSDVDIQTPIGAMAESDPSQSPLVKITADKMEVLRLVDSQDSGTDKPDSEATIAAAVASIKKEDDVDHAIVNDGDVNRDSADVKLQGRKRKASTMVEMTEQMKYCQQILDELFSRKHRSNASPFYGPLDTQSFDFAHYYDVVDNPMDLGIIRTKMENGVYERPEHFAKDIRLIFTNCFRSFANDHELFVRARGLQEAFEVLFAKMPQEADLKVVLKREPRGHEGVYKREWKVKPGPSTEAIPKYTWASVNEQVKKIRSHVDRHKLVSEMKDVLQLTDDKAYFWLDNNNWDLDRAISECLDYEINNPPLGLAMSLVGDITIGEGEEVPPDSKFTKTWRIRNSGDESWPHGCRLCFVSGQKMGHVGDIAVQALAPGECTDVSVEMVSPAEPGIYSGEWCLTTHYGLAFGETIWVIITVRVGGLLSITQQMHRLTELGAQFSGQTDEVVNPFGQCVPKTEPKIEPEDKE